MASARIIGGRWKSRRLEVPPSALTRPMTDRVKEAVFDILGTGFGTPGRLPSLGVLDLFAGSGAMGLEAVSRGAAGCVFVERAPASLRTLRANLDALDGGPTLSIMAVNAWRCRWDSSAHPDERFGLVIVDPPYRDARDTSPAGKVPRLLARLASNAPLTDDAVLVLHHEKAVRFEESKDSAWLADDRREYGRTAITFWHRNPKGSDNAGASDP